MGNCPAIFDEGIFYGVANNVMCHSGNYKERGRGGQMEMEKPTREAEALGVD